MRVAIICIVFLVLTQPSICSVIPPDVPKAVVFIYKDAAGTPAQANGTGFIVSVVSPTNPHLIWLYLITAKHVVHTNSNDFNSPLFSALWVRVNKKSGGFNMYKLGMNTSGDQQVLYFNSDPSVDLAVFTIHPPNLEELDVKVLPEQMLTSVEDLKSLNIGVGSDMFFTGMFTGFLGEKKSYPIVRFGKLAMIPEEKISFAGVSSEGYLMEAFSFGGNSGSPVFFYLSADNTAGMMMIGPPTIKIAGVMKGFFGDYEQVQFLQTQTAVPGPPIPVSSGNTGIALVVPAKFISEILHSTELENKRQTHP